jgi:hypothetical protein
MDHGFIQPQVGIQTPIVTFICKQQDDVAHDVISGMRASCSNRQPIFAATYSLQPFNGVNLPARETTDRRSASADSSERAMRVTTLSPNRRKSDLHQTADRQSNV